MALQASFSSKAALAALGSRQSVAATFGDDVTEEIVGFATRVGGQAGSDVQAFLTSSGKTAAGDKGEPKR